MSNAVSRIEPEVLGSLRTSPDISNHAAPSQEGRRPIAAIVADLSKSLPARFIKTRKQGGAEISYITWATATMFLDHYASGWQWQIVSISEVGGMVVVLGRLTIVGSDGSVSRDATGIEESDSKSFGDPLSNASAMSLKRCAALFGLARSLYHKSLPG
jgi:hypothetical protein